MKVQKSLFNLRNSIMCVLIFLGVLKICFPLHRQTSIEQGVYQADKIVRDANDFMAGKPPIRGSKKWAEASKDTYHGTVQQVHDGDTVHIFDTNGHMHKVRLANIDAPELKQAFGMASRDALKKRIEQQQVDVNVVAIDQYRREVGQIILNNADVNLWMVAQGYAWHYDSIAKKQQNKLDFSRYQQAQIQAQKSRLGLWHNARAVAPWQFRQQQKIH